MTPQKAIPEPESGRGKLRQWFSTTLGRDSVPSSFVGELRQRTRSSSDPTAPLPTGLSPVDTSSFSFPDRPSTSRSQRKHLSEISPDLGVNLGQDCQIRGKEALGPGVVRFIGTIPDMSGVWAGVALKQAVGKNDGSLGGVAYFKCPPKHGIFTPLDSLEPLNQPVDPDQPTWDLLPGRWCLVKGREAQFGPCRVRYVGPIHSRTGEWAGLELLSARGKNDGSLEGHQYFQCGPDYGIFVPRSAVLPAEMPHAFFAELALLCPGITAPELEQLLLTAEGDIRRTLALFALHRLRRARRTDNLDEPVSSWSLADVGAFLRSIQLDEYVRVFSEEKIDGLALVSVTESQLRQMGLRFGEINRLLSHIRPLVRRERGASDYIPEEEVELGHRLGVGNFGEVYSGRWNGRPVAMKKVRLHGDETEANLKKEMRLQQAVGRLCSQVVTAYQLWRPVADNSALYFVMELFPDGSLAEVPLDRRTPQWVSRILFSALLGLGQLHSAGYLHRDISCRNLLIRNVAGAEEVVYADFGLATSIPEGRPLTGFPWRTTAPEAAKEVGQQAWSTASDVYSFGCLIWELATGLRPWPNLEAPPPTYDAFLEAHAFPPSFSAASDLAAACTRLNPLHRPAVKQLTSDVADLAGHLSTQRLTLQQLEGHDYK